jgi:hypothetical protein
MIGYIGGKLIESFPDDCDVYKEQTNEKFLQLFYSDPVRSLCGPNFCIKAW